MNINIVESREIISFFVDTSRCFLFVMFHIFMIFGHYEEYICTCSNRFSCININNKGMKVKIQDRKRNIIKSTT